MVRAQKCVIELSVCFYQLKLCSDLTLSMHQEMCRKPRRTRQLQSTKIFYPRNHL